MGRPATANQGTDKTHSLVNLRFGYSAVSAHCCIMASCKLNLTFAIPQITGGAAIPQAQTSMKPSACWKAI
eukprot:COSAG02_NODE_457_length_21950_cov_35.452794_13_plen_71_part_00